MGRYGVIWGDMGRYACRYRFFHGSSNPPGGVVLCMGCVARRPSLGHGAACLALALSLSLSVFPRRSVVAMGPRGGVSA